MLTTILIALGAFVLGVWLAWRPLSNDLATVRQERRAAHKRCADLQAQRDRFAHDGVMLRGLCADLYASWAESDADADGWWEKYAAVSDIAHDYAIQLSAAKAHDAEIVHTPEVVRVDRFDASPVLREIEAAVPVSPAPVMGFDAPTGSWAFINVRAIEAGPAGKHRLQDVAA